MSKTRNISDLLDANGDVKATALDNVPASDDASALTTGTLPNARLSAVPNSALANSSITINGSATSLGGSATINTDLVNDTTPQLGGDLDTNGNNINFGDDDVLNQGDASEFSIRHEGSTGNTYIRHTPSAPLYIRANKLRVTDSNLSETLLRADLNGDVQLYYDNSVKLATTSSGATVTGTLTSDGVDLGDSEKIRLGASQDLEFYHDGSNSYMKNITGGLFLLGNNAVQIKDESNTKTIAKFVEDGACELYHNNSKKFETTSAGGTLTGTLTATTFSGGGLGKVGQVIQSVKTDTGTTTSSSWSAISGLSASITPSSTSSKILVSFNLNVGQSNSTTAVFRIYRGSTAIGLGESAGSRQRVTTRVSPDNVHWTFPVSNEFLDSPSTTSATTYAIYWKNNSNTVYINRNNSNNNDSSNDQSRPISNITLTEILP